MIIMQHFFTVYSCEADLLGEDLFSGAYTTTTGQFLLTTVQYSRSSLIQTPVATGLENLFG